MRRNVVVSIAAMAAVALALTIAVEVRAQDKQKIADGEDVYNNYCFTCHGEKLVSSGQTFDLRRLKAGDRSRFDSAVLKGKGQMPPWKGVLDDDQINSIWAYIRANAFER